MSKRKNPSDIIYWNDLENDEDLKSCSLAARGLWTTNMLPIAARSPERGVVLVGGHPSLLAVDLPVILARVAGDAPDVVAALLNELITSGSASVDESGRVFNRRMVRQERIRQVRSKAGKEGAEATNRKRQKSGKGVGKHISNGSGKPAGIGVGKTSEPEIDVSIDKQTIIEDSTESLERQTGNRHHSESDGKSSPSSLSSLLPSFATSKKVGESHTIEGEVPAGGGADAPTLDIELPVFLDREINAAVAAYNAIAERVGWSRAQKIDPDRRKALKAAFKVCGGAAGFLIAMEKAEASDFLCGRTSPGKGHENWRPDLDFFLKPKQFRKLMEGGHDNPAGQQRRPEERSLTATLAGLAEAGAR